MANEVKENINNEDDLIINLKNPINFEGENYKAIDLSKLHNIKTSDMIAVNRRMSRNGGDYTTPETSLEYAINMANIATGLPLEFFDQLPPYVAIMIRSRVMGFLFRQE